ncbi:MAG TPA: TonB-dependent receptor [bacterium]|nr:TonB-dependent receptor [bacterium]
MRRWMICLMVLSRFAHAGSAADSDSVKYHLDPMVIIASKILGPQSELPASISVIEEARLSSSAGYSVLETVQNFVPGFYLTERAVMGYGVASGAAGGLSIRGMGGSPVTGVLVLRDGRPDIMGLMGHPLPDAYSGEGIERVEVIRGPASFLYGTNALGGVINLVSKTVREPGFQTRVTAGAGSFATRQLTVGHGGNTGAFDYYLTASTRRSDGHRPHSDYDGDHYTAHAGYRFSAQTQLSLNANLSNIYLLDPGPQTASGAYPQDLWYDIRRSGADLALSHTGGLGETSLQLHGNFGKHRIYDGFRSTDRTVGVMMTHHLRPWTGQTLTLGFDWKRYGGEAKNILQTLDYGRHFISEWAPYVHSQQWLLKKVLASAGLRIDHHPLTGYEALPKAGLVYAVSPAFSLRLSAGRGFRSPSIRELYLFPAPTLDLKPEVMWNYEFGFSHRLADRFKWEGVLFRSQGRDLIRLTGSWPKFRFINSAPFIHTGYEVTLEWLPVDALQLGASWSKNDLQDQTMYSPGKKFTAHAGGSLGPVELALTLMNVRDLYAADFHKKPMKDYTVMNAHLGLTVVKPLRLGLAVKNVLDATYESYYQYPMPGRYFVLQTTASF